MSRLDQEPEVIQMASELGVGWQRDPVRNIIGHCLKKIRSWLDENPVETITDLELLVCKRLRLVFEEIWSDEDLDCIIRKYIALKEPVFATLKTEFDDATYATLLERRSITPEAGDRYVAIIDCRGEKASRRYFTRWHEIAHLLTLVRQLEFPFHRSQGDNSPLERLMDVVAGEVGFYDPIFLPALKAELRSSRHLSFQSIESIRSRFCREASFQATLFAAVRRAPIPLIYVETGLGFKKHEEALLSSPQMNLFPTAKPIAKLRVLQATPNDTARKLRFRIDQNMAVPSTSIIATHFTNADAALSTGTESLSLWRHSDGTALGEGEMRVEARLHRDRVIAMLELITKTP